MTSEWYFQDGEERIGPVTAATLKRLAGEGRVRPDTLVWKNGMAGWAPARSVRGLISAEAATTGPPPLDPPTHRDSAERADQSDGWHPFDLLLSAARQACPPNLPAAISQAAGIAGVHASYAAAFVTLVFGIVVAIHTKEFSVVWLHVVLACAMLGAQYATSRLLASGERTIRSNPSTLSSSAIPDCTAVLTFLGTVGAFLGLMWAGLSTGVFGFALAAVLVLAFGTFASMAAMHPLGLAVTAKPDCLASEDAIGIFAFFVKLLLRCCPIFFFAAVVAGTIEIGRLMIHVVTSDVSGFNPEIDGFQAGFLMGLVINAIAIPAYAYLSAILYYLTLDVISAIVSLPAKVDAIAMADDKRPPGAG